MLLQQRGADVIAFDKNDVYHEQMRYFPIMVMDAINLFQLASSTTDLGGWPFNFVQTGGPSLLSQYSDRALMLGWPDAEGMYVLINLHVALHNIKILIWHYIVELKAWTSSDKIVQPVTEAISLCCKLQSKCCMMYYHVSHLQEHFCRATFLH